MREQERTYDIIERHKCSECRSSFRTKKQLRFHWSGTHTEIGISGSGE